MATTSECVPELLFLKCSRIPSPWEAEANNRKVGFKCMKYAKWSAVHVDDDTGTVLTEVGSRLLDEGEFPREHYGHFARVWEMVQRWTVDRESLSLPAPITDGFEHAQRLLHLGATRRQYVREFLTDLLGVESQTLSWDSSWQLFKQCVATQLLLGSRAVKTLDTALQIVVSVPRAPDQLQVLESVIAEIYRALGFEVEADTPGELLALLLGELGLPVTCDAAETEQGSEGSSAGTSMPSVFFEAKSRTDMRLLEVAVVKDSIVLKFNDRHPAFSGSPALKAALSQSTLWESFGEACRAQLGALEELQSFLDTWGVRLAAATRRGST